MLARGVRNVIYNYTEAQRKVRSATSNDAWGPSPALMHEIADLTDNIVAYAEIMPIIWKRLNDHGKNWRHVYKSLVLLDHLIKYGNERVSQQCKENIFAIQTLKDFQYVEDQKDQGYNVREKAKQLVALLKDDERLRNERRKAQEARERYSRQAMGMDSTGAVTYGRTTSSTSVRRNSAEGDGFAGSSYSTGSNAFSSNSNNRSSSFNENLHSATTKDFVQPSNQEEEQLQMQIALAESQREAEAEERRRRNDDLKLKIALERSINETSPDANQAVKPLELNSSLFDNPPKNDPFLPATTTSIGWNVPNNRPSTHLGFTTQNRSDDPWSAETNGRNSAAPQPTDPWHSNGSALINENQTHANPWGDSHSKSNGNGLSINLSDPWGVSNNQNGTKTASKAVDNELSEFFGATTTISSTNESSSSNPWNISSTTSTTTSSTILQPSSASPTNPSNGTMNNNSSSTTSVTSRKTPESFLGEHFSTLVDFDRLVPLTKGNNPFGSTSVRAPNPFANTVKPPTLEQLSSSTNISFTSTSSLPPPLIPSSYNGNTSSTSTFNASNPFL